VRYLTDDFKHSAILQALWINASLHLPNSALVYLDILLCTNLLLRDGLVRAPLPVIAALFKLFSFSKVLFNRFLNTKQMSNIPFLFLLFSLYQYIPQVAIFQNNY